MAGPAGLVLMGRGRGVRRWAWLVAAIIVTELTFLYRVDIVNSPFVVTSMDTLRSLSMSEFHGSSVGPPHPVSNSGLRSATSGQEGASWTDKSMELEQQLKLTRKREGGSQSGGNVNEVGETCEEQLERADRLEHRRDFSERPILVAAGETQDWPTCAVPCIFKSGLQDLVNPDATFGWRDSPGAARVLRSMESSAYYPDNDVELAHRKGFDVVMTTSLASDVPVGYFSWAEYDLMSPVQIKSERSLAAAFISNCGAHNFRLNALQGLIAKGVTVDSYGGCLHNHGERGVNKLETLRHYKFSLAFENSNVEDYVTEKFWQSLVAGSVPVVVGAPNIHEFEPGPNSLIHIKEEDDVEVAAEYIKYLASNATAYDAMLRWKTDGPTDAFKALVDMAAVHSSCRLCIHLATKIRLQEEAISLASANRLCQCLEKSTTVYHIFVRERGRFEMESIFIRSSNLTVEALEQAVLSKFQSLHRVPIWKSERPKGIQGDNILKVYRIYPLALTQREALYSRKFGSTHSLKEYLEANPCPKLEVIFV